MTSKKGFKVKTNIDTRLRNPISENFSVKDKEETLKKFVKLIEEFSTSEDFKKYGSKIQQAKIEDWLESRVPKSNRLADDGSIRANRGYIRVLKVLISERYGITSLRPNFRG